MSVARENIGTSAVTAALEKARKHSSTAAIAASLLPLSALAPNAAQAAPAYGVDITTSFNTVSGVDYETFTITQIKNVGTDDYIASIDIPELHAGDLNFNYLGNTNSTGGYYATLSEVTTPIYTTALTPVTTDFIEITFSGNQFGSGSQFSITAAVPTLLTANANAGFTTYTGQATPGGPTGSTLGTFAIPDTSTQSVPEPGTMALLASGIAGVMGLRRRRR